MGKNRWYEHIGGVMVQRERIGMLRFENAIAILA